MTVMENAFQTIKKYSLSKKLQEQNHMPFTHTPTFAQMEAWFVYRQFTAYVDWHIKFQQNTKLSH